MSTAMSRSTSGKLIGLPKNAIDISREFKEFANIWFKKGGVLYVAEIYGFFRKHFPQYRMKEDLGDFFIDQALMNWNEKHGHAETKFTGMLVGIQIDCERAAVVKEEEQLRNSRAKEEQDQSQKLQNRDIINQLLASSNSKSIHGKSPKELQLQKLNKAETIKKNESAKQAKAIEEIEKMEEEEKRTFKTRMKSLQARKDIEKKKNLEIQKQLRKINKLRAQITGNCLQRSSSHNLGGEEGGNPQESSLHSRSKSSHTSKSSIKSKAFKTSKNDLQTLLVSVRSSDSVMPKGTMHSMATDSYVSFADADLDDDFPERLSNENDPLFGAVEANPLSLKKKKKLTVRKNSITSCDLTAPESEEEEKPNKLRKTKSVPTKLRKTKSISKMKKTKSTKKKVTTDSSGKVISEIVTGKPVSKIKKKKSVRKLNTSIAAAAGKIESKSISKKSLNGTKNKEVDPEDLSLSSKENRSCATPVSVVRAAFGTGLRKSKKNKSEKNTKKGTTANGKIKTSNKVEEKIKTKKKKNKIFSGDDNIKTNTPMKKTIKKKKMVYQ